MVLSDSKKPIIFFMPGPLRLFWGTGFFLLWLLKDRCDFLICAPEEYRSSEKFQRILELSSVKEIMYFDTPLSSLGHFRCHKIFNAYAKIYGPRFLLLHNVNYPENQYAMRAFTAPSAQVPIIMYQNGRWPIDWQKVSALSLEASSQNVSTVLRLPPAWSRSIARFGRWVKNLVDLRLLPSILQGRAFKPLIDQRSSTPISKNIVDFQRSKNSEYLTILGFNKNEIESYRTSIIPRVTHIHHPIRAVAENAFEFLYGKIELKHQIAILPSVGLSSSLFLSDESNERKAEVIAERWIKALEILQKRTAANFVMKLHPLAEKDPTWHEIVLRLRAAFAGLEVLPSNSPMEGLILASEFIVSDVSTALLWATHLGGRTAISLDIFGYVGGDEMMHYEGIKYITNVDQLRTDDLSPLKLQRIEAQSFNDFISKYLEGFEGVD